MDTLRYRIAGAVALALGALWLAVGTVTAGAPSVPTRSMSDPATPAPSANGGFIRVAGLFGESDEEKAERLQHEQNQDDAINSPQRQAA